MLAKKNNATRIVPVGFEITHLNHHDQNETSSLAYKCIHATIKGVQKNMKKKMLAGLTIGAITLTALLGEVALGGNQVLTRAEAATSTKEVWFTPSENIIADHAIACTTTTLHSGTLNADSVVTYYLSAPGTVVFGNATQSYDQGRHKDCIIYFVSDNTDLAKDVINFTLYCNGITSLYAYYTCLNCQYFPDESTYTVYADTDCKNAIETGNLTTMKTLPVSHTSGKAIRLHWAYTTHAIADQHFGVYALHFTWAC